jgi:hypothetical protein
MNKRYMISPDRYDRPLSFRFACRLPGCRRLVAIANDGNPLALCKSHAEALPGRLFREIEAVAGGSPFNPRAVLEATALVVRIKKWFARRG